MPKGNKIIVIVTNVGEYEKVGYPIVRRLQKRFGRDSAASMLDAVFGAHA